MLYLTQCGVYSDNMGIEEKLEALTHTVELLATMQVESEKHITQLASAQARTEQRLTQLAEETTRLAEESTRLEAGMGRVVNILLIHEQRLDSLEGRGAQ